MVDDVRGCGGCAFSNYGQGALLLGGFSVVLFASYRYFARGIFICSRVHGRAGGQVDCMGGNRNGGRAGPGEEYRGYFCGPCINGPFANCFVDMAYTMGIDSFIDQLHSWVFSAQYKIFDGRSIRCNSGFVLFAEG